MNSRILTSLVALVCISLASCYPYNENQLKNKTTKATEKTPPTTEAQKTAEQQAKADAEAEAKKKTEESTTSTTPAENTTTTTTSTPPSNTVKPAEPKRTEYQVANKVPGKDGFVFSPYNNKVVDVRDIPSGTLVADPTFPAADKKYFRVP